MYHIFRVCYLALVRLAKLILFTLGHLYEHITPSLDEDNSEFKYVFVGSVHESTIYSICKLKNIFLTDAYFFRLDTGILREALQTMPNQNYELLLKGVAESLATILAEQVNMRRLRLFIILIKGASELTIPISR